jgi:DNA-binding MarR family transcriptional regulator
MYVSMAKQTPRGRGFNVSPERSFGYLVRDSARLIISRMTQKIEQHDITLTQYFILRELWEDDGLAVQDLAARVRVAGPSVGTSVDDLEERAFVKRTRSEEDRRRVHVHLTTKGRALREKMLQYAVEVNETALKGISSADIDRTKDVLQRVKENLLAPPRSAKADRSE